MLGFHDPGTDGLTSHPMKTGSYAMVLVRSNWGCVLMAALIALSPQVLALESLNVYTSIKDSLVGELKAAFAKKHPDINIDIQSAGAGKLMAKIAAERAGGEIQADVLWTSEVADFYQLKAAGLLYPYVPVEAAQLINPLPDYDGSFTPVRLGTLGIAYNTTLIARPPRSWDDLLKPEFRNVFGIANPELSGTAYMSVAVLSEKLGWRYFEKLRANGGRIGKGSGLVVEDTASGALSACLAVDYVALDVMSRGGKIALAYPPEILVIPSPVAIFKGSKNIAPAKKFIDFLVSKEGQTIIAKAGTLPVRTDVEVPAHFGLPKTQEAISRAMKINYKTILSKKENILQKFVQIMQK